METWLEDRGVFMSKVVFLFGRPGSGKSSAARQLAHLASEIDCTSVRICDYDILFDWFRKECDNLDDQVEKFFCRTERGGFTVINFIVLDKALEALAEQAQRAFSEQTHDFIFIEFARDDYCKALQKFKRDFLQKAFFFCFDADVKDCMKRIQKRTSSPHPVDHDFPDEHPLDNHYVSDDIVNGYYKDNVEKTVNHLKKEYNLHNQQIRLIPNFGSNSDSWDEFRSSIGESFQFLLNSNIPCPCTECTEQADERAVNCDLLGNNEEFNRDNTFLLEASLTSY